MNYSLEQSLLAKQKYTKKKILSTLQILAVDRPDYTSVKFHAHQFQTGMAHATHDNYSNHHQHKYINRELGFNNKEKDLTTTVSGHAPCLLVLLPLHDHARATWKVLFIE